jgi:bacillithiol biosynthesis cysteine-adding enzyme BshC
MTDARIVTESLGGSPLSRRGRAGELPQWFVTPPSTAAGWQSYARDVIASVPPDWLDRVGPAIAARGAAADRLARSANGKGLVVTTGQQPGLFGGPLMTLAKALTARALADVLEQTTGLPVAPVFWAATDDADFAETASVSLALDGGARALMLEQRTPAGVPSSRVPMGDDLETLTSLLRDACGSAPSAHFLERALAAYRPGATIGDAYVALLRDVLEPLEIAVLDVSHECMAGASAGVMRRAASRAPLVTAAVRRRDAEIEEAGFSPQVEEVPGLSHVFVNVDGTKRRLTQAEAAEFSPADGEWLSATVLLRPVLERALLPTAAYVAGPGEFAYFAQVTAVADALELPRPLVVPRWSTTIIEPRVQRMLDALGITETDLADPHAVESRLARAELPETTATALAALRSDTMTAIDRLRSDDAGLVAPEVVDGVRRDLAHRLDRLERRYIAGVKRRETELMGRIATARGALYPHGIRQERKLAWLPFLARGGAPLIERMLEAAREHARGVVAAAPSLRGGAATSEAPSTARV